MLNKEQIAAATIPPAGTIDAPELGGELGIRSLLASEVIALRTWELDGVDFTAKFVALSLCDSNGARIYADGDEDGVMALPFPLLLRIAERAKELNSMGTEARETIAKN